MTDTVPSNVRDAVDRLDSWTRSKNYPVTQTLIQDVTTLLDHIAPQKRVFDPTPKVDRPRLRPGDHIKANPCTVVITSVGKVRAFGFCDNCDAEHIIDTRMFDNGHGPWTPVEKGTS